MDRKYKGMTVNERLYTSGLINDFDQAVLKKDSQRIIQILNKVEVLDKTTIQSILHSLNLVKVV